MTASQPNDIFQPGDLLNNTYRIECILGRGGTSEVYKARSEISGKVIAIKALRAEFASNEDFLVLMTREEDVREIRHDAVVRYFDTQRMQNGVVYLVMDYVDGPGLDQKLVEGGMTATELMDVGRRVCEGLIAAHNRNIVHRDLSPDNIILRNDTPCEAVIIDFGIAKDTNPGAETIVGNEFAGKYAYAAPEQLSGQTDARSDIYSLGALLLSTFRGAKPNPGRNPMEVVQKKALPLDTEGVPEPLRGLIERMTDPDPALRFQSARELLDAFLNPDRTLQPNKPETTIDADEEATIIVPAASAQPVTPEPIVPQHTDNAAKPASTPKKRGALIPILSGVALVGAAGAAAFFTGALDSVLGPQYPLADPFVMVIEKSEDGALTAQGNVPSVEIETALTGVVQNLGGTSELTLATGNVSEGWGVGLLEAVEVAQPLQEFMISVENNVVRLEGTAENNAEREAIEAAFARGFPGDLSGIVEIEVGARFLLPDLVEPFLINHADCGPLHLKTPPPLGYGREDTILVSGRFASEATRDELLLELNALAAGRPVRIEAEILNESLCEIDAVLPRVSPGGFDVRLGFGDTDIENLSGRFTVGDNPTIDIRLPESTTDGFLWVSVIDVKGVVFHLLPNRTRPDNTIATLKEEAVDGFVRVAFGLEEAQQNGLLAFTVDDSVLGKSKIVALHSERQLFDELRPITESAAGYAQALVDARDSGGLRVSAMDSAILTTAAQ